MTLDGTIVEYPLPTPDAFPNGIVVGPDDALWFTQLRADKVGRLTPDGHLTEYPALGSGPVGIAVGPDGAFWLAGNTGNEILRMTVEGEITHRFPVPTPNASVLRVDVGPDGNIDTGGELGRGAKRRTLPV